MPSSGAQLATVGPSRVAGSRAPLLVDIQALLGSGLALEALLVLLRERRGALWRLSRWLVRGPSYLRRALLHGAFPNTHALPYRPEVLEYLREQKRAGRSLMLLADRDQAAAEAIARELGLFDAVWPLGDRGDSGTEQRRLDVMVERFGAHGFDYLSVQGPSDPLWRVARSGVMVAASDRQARRVATLTDLSKRLDPSRSGISTYLQILRPHQWIKNVLVFMPLAAIHGLTTPALLESCVLAFVAFCLAASSIYIFNDLMDLPEDRGRPQTADRALASGRMRPIEALVLQLGLLLVAAGIGWSLPHGFLWVLAAYYLLMCAYSLVLKQMVVLDILTLAAGYSLRVAAGAVVLRIHPSAWLIALCGALFMSLALLKRYAELIASHGASGAVGTVRGYEAADAPIIATQGIASGYVAILVLALYTTTDLIGRFHGRRELFWLLCALLLYWMNYMWLMARRGRIPHDPLVFALHDRTSLLLVGAMGAAALLAV